MHAAIIIKLFTNIIIPFRSAALTCPLDVVKSQMMTGVSTKGWSATFASIYAQDGIGGLFSGIAPRVGLIAPSVALFFVVYEGTIQRLEGRK
mgnify:CR=1 FL=1